VELSASRVECLAHSLGGVVIKEGYRCFGEKAESTPLETSLESSSLAPIGEIRYPEESSIAASIDTAAELVDVGRKSDDRAYRGGGDDNGRGASVPSLKVTGRPAHHRAGPKGFPSPCANYDT